MFCKQCEKDNQEDYPHSCYNKRELNLLIYLGDEIAKLGHDEPQLFKYGADVEVLKKALIKKLYIDNFE